MIPAYLLTETVTLVQASTTEDRYHNDQPDWDGATRTEIRAWIERRDTSEQRDGRDTIMSRWLFMTNDLTVTAHDRIEWNDGVYEIDGEVSVEHTPRGAHHLEANLLHVEG